MALKAQPLLHTRTRQEEFAIVIGGPVVFGIVTGVLLGVSKPLYLLFSVLGILGGYLAGYEHDDVSEGFYRGLLGGLLFGSTILLTNAIIGAAPKADLPDPEIYLVAITSIAGFLLGILGARARRKRELTRSG